MVLPEGCNTEWVVSHLDKFIRITDGKFVSGPGGEFDPMWDSDFDRDEMGGADDSLDQPKRLVPCLSGTAWGSSSRATASCGARCRKRCTRPAAP